MFISDISSKIFNSAREYYQNKIIKLVLLEKNRCTSFNPFAK